MISIDGIVQESESIVGARESNMLDRSISRPGLMVSRTTVRVHEFARAMLLDRDSLDSLQLLIFWNPKSSHLLVVGSVSTLFF